MDPEEKANGPRVFVYIYMCIYICLAVLHVGLITADLL